MSNLNNKKKNDAKKEEQQKILEEQEIRHIEGKEQGKILEKIVNQRQKKEKEKYKRIKE